ncbi:MAG: phospho-N-acetylmuramoyl-pentapeptide-transferase [Clostridia bacterium]|nr:phospho-N-acetylmuramoyl-pentapeptide-transferase [Clostridia bacterium]
MIIEFITVALAVFFVTVILEKLIIPILQSRKVGQKILEIGPRWHKNKAGTPTMGGICFIMAILAVMVIVAIIFDVNGESGELIPLALALGLAVLNGMIGFFDDYTKLVKKQNEGFTAKQKIILQSLAAILYLAAMSLTDNINTALHIPFTSVSLELGWFYYVFAFVLIIGFVNSVNLTDGIDGLASSVTLVVGLFFAAVGMSLNDKILILIGAALVGATAGFLVYNFYPARVFMGDTGSLFLGGLVVGAVFVLDEPMIIFLVGIIYLIEAASDIIQVGVFKLSGRKIRVFKMAPIHHHFEKCGWSEIKIVVIFSLVTLAFCVLAYFGI